MGGYAQGTPPAAGRNPTVVAQRIVGWRVQILFPRQDGVQVWWDGFVFDSKVDSTGLCVRVLCEDGFEDWYSQLDADPTVAFHTSKKCQRKTCRCQGNGVYAPLPEVQAALAAGNQGH